MSQQQKKEERTAGTSGRRAFLKRAAGGALGIALGSGAAAAPGKRPLQPGRAMTPVASLPQGVTRPWLGPAFWGNRLQDWRLRDGRMECLRGEVGYEVRTVSLLTREIVRGDAPGHISVETGVLGNEVKPGFCGLLVGVGGEGLAPRARALVQRGSGTGGGFMATFDAGGQVHFREHTSEEAPLAFAELPAERIQITAGGGVDRTAQAFRIELDLQPTDDGRFDVHFTVRDLPAGKRRALITRTDVPEEELLGGIALVSSPPTGEAGARWWFRNVQTDGEKIAIRDERALGPVVGTLYSLDEDVLKLSAQFMPLGDAESQAARLEVRPSGTGAAWQERATASIEDGYTALFRVEGWDASRDWDYRVAYDGTSGTSTYTGRIRKAPTDGSELKIGLYSCTMASARQLEASPGAPELPQSKLLGRYTPENMYFPYDGLVQHSGAHDPDLLVFAGDQLYESWPTRTDTTGTQPLDYLYKWYLWLWAFRDLTRDRPTLLLADDHDVYQGNLWGEGGEAAPNGNQNRGGYVFSPAFVNMVQRTQTSHNPDPYDATPAEQGITVYYSAFRYGGVSFAIVEDRKFKSGRPMDGEDPATLELLGERQERFLEAWAEMHPGLPKVCLSQTCWACVMTGPDGTRRRSYDSNGYPSAARDRALRLVRGAGALMLAGDQHLATVVRHGLDDVADGPVQFSGPAGASFWQRWFAPARALSNSRNGLPHTGDFEDAFGNNVRVEAVANPKVSFAAFRQHIQGTNALGDRSLKSEGYGLVRVNLAEEAFEIECWPWDEDPRQPGAQQFAGWPYRVSFDEAGGRAG